MKMDQTRYGCRWATIVVLFSIVAQGVLSAAWGQEITTVEGISAPLYIGNCEPLLDPYGRPLAGAHAGPVRSLVELRVATNNLVVPPHTNGMSHPYNPLLTADTKGGMGLNTTGTNLGLFCMVLPTRPSGNMQVFARAYNAPTAAEATFYADSDPVYLSQSATSKIVVNFHKARPMDWGDSDGDGLANSWERLLGTDGVATNDFDGDGMLDLHEMLAGSDPTDENSRLVIDVVRHATQPMNLAAAEGGELANPVLVSWQSVPGKTYRLEHVPLLAALDPITGEPYVFEVVREVVAREGETTIDVWVDVTDAPTGIFRVKLVP